MTSEMLVSKIYTEVARLTLLGRNRTFLPTVVISPNELEKAKAVVKEQLPDVIIDARRCPRGKYDIILEWQ